MDGTSYTIDIRTDGAASAASAASAVEKLASSLESAQSAAQLAANALAAGQASYSSAEAAANSAAKAVERIGVAAEAQRGKLDAAFAMGDLAGAQRADAKLGALLAKQASAAERAQQAASALQTEAQALDRLKESAASAQAEESRLSDAHTQAAKSAKDMAKASDLAAQAAKGSGKINEAAEGLGKIGGPVGQLGQKILGPIEGVKKLYGALGDKAMLIVAAAGIALVAVAVVALAAAVVVGVAKFAQWAVGLADAARNQQLLAAGIAGTVVGGEALNAKIQDLQKRVPLASDELLRMAGDLKKTGLEGKALEGALEDAAVKAAKLKFGPEFGRAMLSLDNQSKRLKDNIAGIFGGLKIEKLLESFSRFVELFDATEVTGNVIKMLFEEMFQPAIDGSATFVDKVTAAFIQAEIWVLRSLISLKGYGAELRTAGEIASAVGSVIAFSFGIAWDIFKNFAFVVSEVVLNTLALYNAFATAAAGVENFRTSIRASLLSIDLSEIGRNMIAGLAAGITSGATAVVSAVSGAATGAIGAAKSILQINSPSKVFAEIGGSVTEGMGLGVDRGTDDVRQSVEALVAPPAPPASASGKPVAGGLSGANNITININGVKGAAEAVEQLRAAVLQLLEGDVAMLGGEVPSA